MALIGKIAVGVTANTAGFRTGLARAGKDLKRFVFATRRARANIVAGFSRMGAAVSGSFRALGRATRRAGFVVAAGAAAAGAGLALMVKRGLEAGDAFDKMAARTGLTVKFLAGLKHAAERGGSSIGAMEKAIRRLQRAALDSQFGLETYTRLFELLEVSVADTRGELKPTEQLFLETVGALSRMSNETKKAALAATLFGRSGTELLPMLQNGERGLMELMKRSEELGNVWTGSTARAAAITVDQLGDLQSILSNLQSRISIVFIPTILKVAKSIEKWYLANQQLIHQRVQEFALTIITGIKALVPRVLAVANRVREWYSANRDIIQQDIRGVIRSIGEVFRWVANTIVPFIRNNKDLLIQLGKLAIVLKVINTLGLVQLGTGILQLIGHLPKLVTGLVSATKALWGLAAAKSAAAVAGAGGKAAIGARLGGAVARLGGLAAAGGTAVGAAGALAIGGTVAAGAAIGATAGHLIVKHTGLDEFLGETGARLAGFKGSVGALEGVDDPGLRAYIERIQSGGGSGGRADGFLERIANNTGRNQARAS